MNSQIPENFPHQMGDGYNSLINVMLVALTIPHQFISDPHLQMTCTDIVVQYDVKTPV